MRLGEILLADGLIVSDELEAAVAEQRQSGARLGSVLYLRGRVSADGIARALARLHGVPAALMRHLDSRDPTLTARIPSAIAQRWLALPVALSKGRAGTEPGGQPGPALVVCMRDPRDTSAIAELRAAVAMPMIISVACEAVLATLVARAYPRYDGEDDGVDVDFDDPSGTMALPLADDDAFGSLALVDLDDKRVARDHTQASMMPTRPSGSMSVPRNESSPALRLHGEPAVIAPPDAALAAGTLRPGAPVAAPPPPTAPPPRAPTAPPIATAPVAAPPQAPPVLGVDPAIAAIAEATSRDEVGDDAIAFLRGAYGSAAILVVRDGIALGHRGFGGGVTPATVESIVVPLNLPSVLRVAHDGARTFVGTPPADAGTVQDRFLRLLGSPREVVVAPVVLRDRPVCLVFAAKPLGDAEDALSDLLVVVAAMEEAYLRLIRDAKKSTAATSSA